MTNDIIFLCDMDGVLCDLEGEFYFLWEKENPNKILKPIAQRTEFYIEKDHPDEWAEDIFKILDSPGFYRALPSIKGAVRWLMEIDQLPGIEVKICTSPSLSNPTCVQDKYAWVRSRLGKEWERKIIITKDKTLIHGDFLLDDRPTIDGANPKPTWSRLVFDHPFNKDAKGRHFNDWEQVHQFFKTISDLHEAEVTREVLERKFSEMKGFEGVGLGMGKEDTFYMVVKFNTIGSRDLPKEYNGFEVRQVTDTRHVTAV